MAERVGFEPTDGIPSAVFKTVFFNHSNTFPCQFDSSEDILPAYPAVSFPVAGSNQVTRIFDCADFAHIINTFYLAEHNIPNMKNCVGFYMLNINTLLIFNDGGHGSACIDQIAIFAV